MFADADGTCPHCGRNVTEAPDRSTITSPAANEDAIGAAYPLRAAKASCVCFAASVILSCCTFPDSIPEAVDPLVQISRIVYALLPIVLAAGGFGLGLIAIVKRRGHDGVLPYAVTGTILNGLYVGFIIFGTYVLFFK
ncbi:MAG: hypothetical protein CMJ18_25615 [Phycisphaeraceae bacterium]|nr:hypothetical protein [Phycisphaeraceae bacterium]